MIAKVACWLNGSGRAEADRLVAMLLYPGDLAYCFGPGMVPTLWVEGSLQECTFGAAYAWRSLLLVSQDNAIQLHA